MTYLCKKMIAEQQRYAADTRDNVDLLWQHVAHDWSDPGAPRSMPAAIRRTGETYNRMLIVIVEWDRAARPGRDSDGAHELCDDDQAALDAFMAGGL